MDYEEDVVPSHSILQKSYYEDESKTSHESRVGSSSGLHNKQKCSIS